MAPPNRAPSPGRLLWGPGTRAQLQLQTYVSGGHGSATAGRRGGLVSPKTIRVPEVRSTLIPVLKFENLAVTDASEGFYLRPVCPATHAPSHLQV